MASVQQNLIEKRLQRPQHALDVVVHERDIRIVVVKPESNPLAQAFPLLAILEHTLAAQPIEFGDTERFDLLLSTDTELLFDLDLHWKTVRVPAGFARDAHALHRAVAAK